MNKTIKLVGATLLMAVSIGLTFIGCDDSTDGGGTLTVKGIPAKYNGKYAVFMSGNDDDDDGLLGAAVVNADGKSGTAVKIGNGSVSLPIWTMSKSGIVRYSGSDTVDGEFMIFDQASVGEETNPIAGFLFESVAFKNGSATISYADGKEFDFESGYGDGGTLTVTGIPSEHNGKYILFMSDDEGGGGEPVPGSVFILGAQSVDANTMTATLGQIQNGTAQLPMHKVMFTEQGINSETYYDTESLSGEVTISSTNTTSPGNDTQPLAGKSFSSIQFTNGSASINWANGT